MLQKRKYHDENYQHPPSKRSHQCIDPQSFRHLLTTTDSFSYSGDKNDFFSVKIWDTFRNHCQRQREFDRKIFLWSEIDRVISSNFGYSTHVFGSTINGLAGRDSDMDICVFTYHEGDLVRFLAQMRKLLRRKCDFLHHNIELVPAKVPILKFYDEVGKIEVDLSCANDQALRNSHLLFCYSQVKFLIK